MAALRELLSRDFRVDEGLAPRWARVNTLVTTLEEQLSTTFEQFANVGSVEEVMRPVGSGVGVGAGAAGKDGADGKKLVYVDEHIPNLIAVSPGVDLSKTEAYKTSAIILQDKASCFPAYLLDQAPEDGDVVDACAAPGNKTTHLAAILHSKSKPDEASKPKGSKSRVLAFEKDATRAQTLERRSQAAGAADIICVHAGQDFLKVDPCDRQYKNVTALLLDPSCSGSGMLNRDYMPELHLPSPPSKPPSKNDSKKRKSKDFSVKKPLQTPQKGPADSTSPSEPKPAPDPARLEALAAFQILIIQHAFSFPAARRVTYSTCSIHNEENEHVAVTVLASDVAKTRGWRLMKREEQVDGMRRWEVRGRLEACDGDAELAGACIRSFPGDGRGVMGFFAVGFVRE